MLLLALLDWPYGYYIFLRWFVAGSAGFLAWVSFNLNKPIIALIAVFLALLFNPIVPVHLDRGTWSVIDLVAAGFFGFSAWSIKPTKKEKDIE